MGQIAMEEAAREPNALIHVIPFPDPSFLFPPTLTLPTHVNRKSITPIGVG